MHVVPPHRLEAPALEDERPEGEVCPVYDDRGDWDGAVGDGPVFVRDRERSEEPAVALNLDTMPLVRADKPVRRVGRPFVKRWVRRGVGAEREALLVGVADCGEDLGERGGEGADGGPLELCRRLAVFVGGGGKGEHTTLDKSA